MKKSVYSKYTLILKILLTCLLIKLLISNSVLNLSSLKSLATHPIIIIVCMLLCYAMILMNSWRWYQLNTVQQIHLPFTQTILPTYLGIAFNNVLPGSVGGDIVRMYYIIKKFPAKKSAAALSILVDRVNGLMGMLVLACAVILYYFVAFRHDSKLLYLLMSTGAMLAIGVLFFLSTAFISGKNGLSSWLETKMQASRWKDNFKQIINAIHVYRHSPFILIESIICSMMTQIFILAVVILLNYVLGLPAVAWGNFLLAAIVGQIANLLPLTPGGIGVGEAAFANVIIILNPGATAAYATVFFAMRLVSTIAYLPGVLYGIFGLKLNDKKATDYIDTKILE